MSVPSELATAISNAEAAFGLPHGILTAIWRWESGSSYPNPYVNSIGCGGLFGLCQGGSASGIDLFDPSTTVAQANRAAQTLKGLIDANGGNLQAALNQYDGGSASETSFILQSVGGATAAVVSAAQSAFNAIFGSSVTITQPFGCTSDTAETPSSSCPSGFTHLGVDYAVPSGTQLPSLVSGQVVQAGWSDEGYGIHVVVQTVDSLGRTIDVLYGHMQSLGVSVGQQVTQGQILGLSNNTGNSTGPHVHVGEQVNGTWVDPTALIQSVLGGSSSPSSGQGSTIDASMTAGLGSDLQALSRIGTSLAAIASFIGETLNATKSVFTDLGRLGAWLASGPHWAEIGLLTFGGLLAVAGAGALFGVSFKRDYQEEAA